MSNNERNANQNEPPRKPIPTLVLKRPNWFLRTFCPLMVKEQEERWRQQNEINEQFDELYNSLEKRLNALAERERGMHDPVYRQSP